jgi:nitrous oxidase accessory protein NosD
VGRGPRAHVKSLRTALRQAEPSATILLLPGRYEEPFVVDKDVTLRGEGDAAGILLTEGITVAPGVRLTLIHVTVGNSWGVALRLLPGARVWAEETSFQDAAAGGVELGPETAGDFLRCRFNRNGCAGILALEGSRATLNDCELAGNRDAGLHACGGARGQLQSCRVVANLGVGVSAVDAAEIAMDRCELGGNREPGMLLDRGASGRLVQCHVTGGVSLGIQCRQGGRVALEHCLVEGNALGGLLMAGEALAEALGPENRILDGILQF